MTNYWRLNMTRILLFFILFITLSSPTFSQNETKDSLFSLSMDELLKVEFSTSASITEVNPIEVPASITIISRKDIENTPHRNIYDLLETFVPSAFWMNYEEGPQLGNRGMISNNNTQYLLLLNGIQINNKGRYGAVSELEQWDLQDIERIEIIRGPGSVVFGPGAIAGVINIIPQSDKTGKGFGVATRYVTKYNSKGASYKYGLNKEKFGIYTYGSMTQTSGYTAPHYYATSNNEVGYIGKTILLDKEPLDFMGDHRDTPQAKFYINGRYKKFNFFSRYTQQGSNWASNEVKTEYDGVLYNQQTLRNRQFSSGILYDQTYDNELRFNAKVNFITADIERVRENDLSGSNQPYHILNKQSDFGEEEVNVYGMVSKPLRSNIAIAVGSNYMVNHFGPGWGKSPENMRLGDNGIMVNGPNSNAIMEGSAGSANRDSSAIFVGDGWYSHNFAIFSELNIDFNDKLKLLISGRADKNSFAAWAYSPRAALIWNVKKSNYLKLIAQRSVRLNTGTQLYTEYLLDEEDKTEKLSGLELIFNGKRSSKLKYNISTYLNNIELIGFDTDEDRTFNIGTLLTCGGEVDASYNWNGHSITMMYSYNKQLSWKLADSVEISAISFSDYNYQTIGTGVTLADYGNDLNNVPKHMIKLIGNFKLTDKLNWHINTRLFEGYDGTAAGIESLRAGAKGSAYEEEVNDAINEVENSNALKADFRFNTSLTYTLFNKLDVQIYGLNIIPVNGSRRNAYNQGNKRSAPNFIRFIEEPTVIGFKLTYNI